MRTSFHGVLSYLKLDWPPCLLLNDGCARSVIWSANDIADLDLSEITASKLAVIARAIIAIFFGRNGRRKCPLLGSKNLDRNA